MVWHTIKIKNPANAAAELTDEIKKLNLSSGSAAQLYIQVGDSASPQRAMVEIVPHEAIYHYDSRGRPVTDVLQNALQFVFPQSKFIDTSGEELRKLNEPFLKGEGPPNIPSLDEITPEKGFEKITKHRAQIARESMAKQAAAVSKKPEVPVTSSASKGWRANSLFGFKKAKAPVLNTPEPKKDSPHISENSQKLKK